MYEGKNTDIKTGKQSVAATRSGGVAPPAFFQPKLTVNLPNDPYEREADAMAERVMRQVAPVENNTSFQPLALVAQRKCAACEEEEEHVQRKEGNPASPQVDAGFESYVSSLGTRGQPLAAPERDFFEPRFNHDFSNVRIHHDSEAARSAQKINALAYTSGHNIVFNSEQYQPGSDSGKRLLAHELTHVVQQQGNSMTGIGRSPQRDQLSLKSDAGFIQRNATTDTVRGRLTESLDMGNLSAVDRRLLDRRVREEAARRLNTLRESIRELPEVPTHPRYTGLVSIFEESLASIQNHPDEANRRVRGEHLSVVLGLMRSDKLVAYYQISGDEQHYAILREGVRRFGNIDITADTDHLMYWESMTQAIRRNPERVLLSEIVGNFYTMLGAPQPRLQNGSTYTGGEDNSAVPNSPALPAEIIGPTAQVKNATGTYTMRLDYSVAGHDLLSQVVEAMNWVNYRWELYDITAEYNTRIHAEIERLRAREEGDSSASVHEIALENIRQQPISGDHHVGQMAASSRRWQRFAEQQVEDFENNWEDVTNPSAGSNGTLIDAIGNRFIAEFNLGTTVLSASFGAVSQLLSTFSDLLGGAFYEKEIPFPDQEGWFLVRCIAQPSAQGTADDPVLRAPSVSTKIVRVREIRGFTDEQVGDLDELLTARRIELETSLSFVSDPADRTRIERELNAVRVELEGSGEAIIQSRIDQLTTLRARATNRREREQVDGQLAVLRAQLRIANARAGEMVQATITRPRAVFVSEETSQTVPLLLQLGRVSASHEGYHYQLSDVTGRDSSQWDGAGDTASEAVTRAFNQFARESPYGRGILSVRLQRGMPHGIDQTVFRCQRRGGAMAVARLEQVLTVLTVLGLMAVPGVGVAAAVGGAAIAAGRIISKINNHTFRWNDPAVFTDMLSILGAAASGAAVVGRMRVIRTSRMFAVVADDADVIRMIQMLNRSASRFELLDEFIGWGGYLWGNIVLFDEFLQIQAKVLGGEMTAAEARRRRAELLASAVRDGGFQFAGFRPEQTATRFRDGFGPPHHDGTPADGPQAPATTRPTDVSERRPMPQAEPTASAVLEASVQGGEVTGVRPAPDAELARAGIARLTRRIGDMPEGLRHLLTADSNLLQRALLDPQLIHRSNVDAWNEIASLGALHPDTYPLLLRDSELRRALVSNPGAARALKHCASPCFPSNASAADVLALQNLISVRAGQGLSTDFNRLNQFLYNHRDMSELSLVVRALEADFDAALSWGDLSGVLTSANPTEFYAVLQLGQSRLYMDESGRIGRATRVSAERTVIELELRGTASVRGNYQVGGQPAGVSGSGLPTGRNGFEALHGAGPIVGYESPQGILFGPWHINHDLQVHGIEQTLQDIGSRKAPGASIRLVITVDRFTGSTRYPNAQGVEFLQGVRYELVASGNGERRVSVFDASIHVDTPDDPNSSVDVSAPRMSVDIDNFLTSPVSLPPVPWTPRATSDLRPGFAQRYIQNINRVIAQLEAMPNQDARAYAQLLRRELQEYLGSSNARTQANRLRRDVVVNLNETLNESVFANFPALRPIMRDR